MAGGLRFLGPMSGIASLPFILGSAWYGVNRIKFPVEINDRFVFSHHV
ncbi:hypothetical protein NTHI1209_01187 [Haemophilus influenzae]|uniref:Uncharacterized protein n=1 Tax=Haemophilus influenzae TaxID=727 RepID=A0A158SXI6_HAEIF|nr:hypothetical protein NTHI1209_01187 [Haemophilus influenzae]